MRVTRADLEARVSRIARLLPDKQFILEHDAQGWRINYVVGAGWDHLSPCLPAAQLYDWLGAFEDGIRWGQQG